MTDISIITVAGPNSQELLTRNIQLIKKLNPTSNFNFYVIDNSSSAGGKPIEKNDDWTVFDGVEMVNKEMYGTNYASMHHALALNKFLQENEILTDLCLILDPDFYVFKPRWISLINDIMLKEKLSLLGAPWHPKWFTKYRDFPCVHFFLFKTAILNPKNLDFRPGLITKQRDENQKVLSKLIKKIPIFNFLFSLFVLRNQIGRSKDTGYRVYRDLSSDQNFLSSYKTFQPVLNKTDFQNVMHLKYSIGRFCEKFFPDSISFVPSAQVGTISYSKLSNLIYNEVVLNGWEEFHFLDELFAVHMRNYPSSAIEKEINLNLLDKLIEIHSN